MQMQLQLPFYPFFLYLSRTVLAMVRKALVLLLPLPLPLPFPLPFFPGHDNDDGICTCISITSSSIQMNPPTRACTLHTLAPQLPKLGGVHLGQSSLACLQLALYAFPCHRIFTFLRSLPSCVPSAECRASAPQAFSQSGPSSFAARFLVGFQPSSPPPATLWMIHSNRRWLWLAASSFFNTNRR
jgi:hypothetical protein